MSTPDMDLSACPCSAPPPPGDPRDPPNRDAASRITVDPGGACDSQAAGLVGTDPAAAPRSIVRSWNATIRATGRSSPASPAAPALFDAARDSPAWSESSADARAVSVPVSASPTSSESSASSHGMRGVGRAAEGVAAPVMSAGTRITSTERMHDGSLRFLRRTAHDRQSSPGSSSCVSHCSLMPWFRL